MQFTAGGFAIFRSEFGVMNHKQIPAIGVGYLGANSGEFLREPNVILIAKSDVVSVATLGGSEKVFSETQIVLVAMETDWKRRSSRKISHNLFSAIGRSIVADLQLERKARLRR
jgi:hypothetical protein